MTLNNFSDGQYKINSIEVEDEAGKTIVLYTTSGSPDGGMASFEVNKPFKLRVAYECTLDEVPDVSCGVAVALTDVKTMEHACYFNTNYPHSDTEMANYDDADFRKYKGRTGVIEGVLPRLQIRPGDYFLSVGILANIPQAHEFYEFHYLRYKLKVSGQDFPAIFLANATVRQIADTSTEEAIALLKQRGTNDPERTLADLKRLLGVTH